MPPMSEPGCSTQYRTLGRCSTNRERSAWKTMFMLPARSISPSNGSPTSLATWLRPPSAPSTYFARMAYSCPDSRSRTVTVTPASSCTSDTYSVSNRIRLPRAAAWPTSIGSSSVCGRSQFFDGLARV